MQTILAYLLIIATVGYNTEAQQIYRNQVQIASNPAQNEFIRLSEIPFENAVRAVITPQRDYVPIHEPQRDIPPPQRPQPIRQEPHYNLNIPQTYSNVAPMHIVYNTQYPMQQLTNAPMSFQYMTMRDYPNEVYNFLYHTNSRNIGYAQGNKEQFQTNYLQQAYDPNMSGYHVPVAQIPVINNNFAAILPQSISQVPVYNNFQSSAAYNNFRPSQPISQNFIGLSTNQEQINTVPVHKFRTGKSPNFALPNVQYVNSIQGTNGFVPSAFVPIRSSRIPSRNGQDYVENSKYVSSLGIDS